MNYPETEELLTKLCDYVVDWFTYLEEKYFDLYDFFTVYDSVPNKNVEKDIEMTSIKIKKE